MSLTNGHEILRRRNMIESLDDVSPEKIKEILDKTYKDNLFGEGWQGVKQSFNLGILSVGHFVVGVYYMLKGFPNYIGNRLFKKKKPSIVLSELPWKDHNGSGLNVGYHFPLLKEKEKMSQIINHISGHKTGLHRSSAKYPGITTVKTYEDIMAETDPNDNVFHFGTGNNGKGVK